MRPSPRRETSPRSDLERGKNLSMFKKLKRTGAAGQQRTGKKVSPFRLKLYVGRD